MNLTRQGKNFYRQRMMQIVKGRSMDELSKQEMIAVRKISKLIGADTMGESHPLPKMKIEEFTYEKYQQLIELGYLSMDIREALGISSSAFLKWKYENFPKDTLKKMQKKRKVQKAGGTVE